MRISLLAVSLFCSTLAAQSVTSPRGFDTVEGNTSFAHFGGNRRFQQLDFTQNGSPMVISSLAWRRNGGTVSTTSLRTLDFQVDMGRCNFGAIEQILDKNYLPGTRTTVFNQTGINFPDWSAAQPTPAPFDFSVVLSTPYVYSGADALVIDFFHNNTSVSGTLALDREFNGPTTPPAGTLLGTGCIATGRTTAFSHVAYISNHDVVPVPAFGMRLRLGGTNAPSTATLSYAFLDVTNQNLTGPLCSTLYASPLVSIPLTTLSTGVVPDLSLGFTYNAAFIGATLYSQLVAVDAAQPIPVVVSNGRQLTMPSTVAAGINHRCSYGWYSLPSTTGYATHFTGGGMVIKLN